MFIGGRCHLLKEVITSMQRRRAICNDEEKKMNRTRSTTTLGSFKNTDPHDYDRVMGISLMGPQETVRFGEGDAIDVDDN